MYYLEEEIVCLGISSARTQLQLPMKETDPAVVFLYLLCPVGKRSHGKHSPGREKEEGGRWSPQVASLELSPEANLLSLSLSLSLSGGVAFVAALSRKQEG